jgi:hypothetical protein
MNTTPYLEDYDQKDIEKLYATGSIVPNIDEYGNLIIQNAMDEMYSSSITIPLQNQMYLPTKVETVYNVNFIEL